MFIIPTTEAYLAASRFEMIHNTIGNKRTPAIRCNTNCA